MADPESLRQITRSPAPLSTWLGVVLLFGLFGVIVLAIIGPSPRGSDYEESRAKKRLENLKTSREDAEKALNTYAWVDKNKGVVRIPISRAMELSVAQLTQQKPAQAGPIATPASETQATAVSTSPAPGSPKPSAAQPQGAAVSSPPASGAVSPSPAAVQSPPAPASAAPAKTP
jgi:hypothetical protein